MRWVVRMVLVAGMGLASGAGAGGSVTFDCVALSLKSGDPETVCALFGQRLAAALPGQQVRRAPDAEIVLVIDRAAARNFMVRVDRRGQPPGTFRGIARFDADLDDGARSDLIDQLLQDVLR